MLHAATVRKILRGIKQGESWAVHQDVVYQIVTEARRQNMAVEITEYEANPFLRVVRLCKTGA